MTDEIAAPDSFDRSDPGGSADRSDSILPDQQSDRRDLPRQGETRRRRGYRKVDKPTVRP